MEENTVTVHPALDFIVTVFSLSDDGCAQHLHRYMNVPYYYFAQSLIPPQSQLRQKLRSADKAIYSDFDLAVCATPMIFLFPWDEQFLFLPHMNDKISE